MKTLSVLCIAFCVGLSTTAAFARGGMQGNRMSEGPSYCVGREI
jgi:hypothetical protein